MIELQDVCFSIRKDGEDVLLVNQASLAVPKGHFMAIVGPSGCGKTTLLKTIAGLNPESSGSLFWEGRNLSEDGDFMPTEIGYVPQFSIAYDPLTVDESVETATRLRVKTRDIHELDARIDRVMEETGLAAIGDRKVKVLSGGQKRRLGLAMELVSDPKLLLCDEVTSGLDPRSEREIVRLLHDLSRKDGRIVMSVTHSLGHLELYDSILVLHEGCVAFHGPPDQLTHYFSVNDTEEVYPRLASQPAERWHASWQKHRASYAAMIEKRRQQLIASGSLQVPADEPVARASRPDTEDSSDNEDAVDEGGQASARVEHSSALPLPGWFAQFSTLLSRRWRIFFRDRGQVLLQVAILLCFPVLVTLFSDKASGNIRSFSDKPSTNILDSIQEQQSVMSDRAKVGSAVSGIIMFQVVLLSLMGSNNSAREIAGERQVFEKEKFGGLRPTAYLGSKIAFLACLVIIQSLWMAMFVNFVRIFDGNLVDWSGTFRGDIVDHTIFLLLVNGAMTFICLAISALMRTAEQASLLSIYLVGFQLPLSGAVLALPVKIDALTRPFISAYWAWSGSISALQGTVQGAVKSVIDTGLSGREICLYVLCLHMGAALIAAWVGVCRPQWE